MSFEIKIVLIFVGGILVIILFSAGVVSLLNGHYNQRCSRLGPEWRGTVHQNICANQNGEVRYI